MDTWIFNRVLLYDIQIVTDRLLALLEYFYLFIHNNSLFTGYLPGAAAPGTGLDLRHVVLLSKIVQPIGLVRL